MFKEFQEERIFRFKEFDEARVYIETLKDREETFEAVDYMINHKEYYFLLKNILRQINVKKGILAYAFFNLPCMQRKEDLNLLIEIMKKSDEVLKKIVIDYIKSCNSLIFAKKIYESGLKCEAIEIFKKFPEAKNYLKNSLDKETETEVLKKAVEFFEIYDEDFADKLKEKIGNK